MVVAALAGRRIDPPGGIPARFPISRVSEVKAALSEKFEKNRVTDLICSAACGADLVALSVAIDMKIRFRIILPFDIHTFRQTSVVDRPGDWGNLYDEFVAAAKTFGNLIVLNGNPRDESSYSRANHEIIREAKIISPLSLAIVVWEGSSRGNDDATEEFRRLARKEKFKIITVKTC